jgi:hypothetical protein
VGGEKSLESVNVKARAFYLPSSHHITAVI